MPVLAIAALMGVLFLPGSATAPVHAQVSTSTPSTVAVSEDEPSKRPAPSLEAAAHYLVSMTAYNAVSGQTDGDPMTTASGMRSNPQIIAARSLDLASELPFGTVIKVERTVMDTPRCQFSKVAPQIGYRVIGDTMAARMVNKVDIQLDQNNTIPVNGRLMNPALVMGVCATVSITVVGHIDPAHIPTTQAALAAMYETPKLAIR